MALKGIRVLELSGLAPAPFCGMILADFGASVVRIDKNPPGPDLDCLSSGKKSISLNLKTTEGANILKRLSRNADVLIEPFRPGIMEKLGLGPKELMSENKKLIYARMAGFGQTGPNMKKAGHDLSYMASSGVLSLLIRKGQTLVPSIADFAGGGLLCAFGIVAALLERSKSGLGQVLDASLSGGSAYVCSWHFRSRNLPLIWTGEFGTNIFDGGHHGYNVYETLDRKWLAVGTLEPQFYENFLKGLGLTSEELPQDSDPVIAKQLIKEIFIKHPQSYWLEVYKDLDACVSPVNSISEAVAANPEGYIYSGDNIWCPVPFPQFSRTPASSQGNQPNITAGQDSEQLLKNAGYSNEEIQKLINDGIIFQAKL